MSSKHKSMHDLFQHQLKDLYHAERHGGKLFLKMAKATTSNALQTALEQRHDDMVANVGRLEAIFEVIDKKVHGVPCAAMEGIIEETKTLLDDFDGSPVLDMGLIAAALAVEHYAVARYTVLQLWAAQMGLAAAHAPIETSLAEAKRAMARWTSLAGTVATLATVAATEAPMSVKDAALVGLR